MQILLHPDSKEEADCLYKNLSEGGSEDRPMADSFWGSYHGTLTDPFGVQWMIDFNKECGMNH